MEARSQESWRITYRDSNGRTLRSADFSTREGVLAKAYYLRHDGFVIVGIEDASGNTLGIAAIEDWRKRNIDLCS